MPREVYQFGEMMPDSYGLQADVLQAVINMLPAPDGYYADLGLRSPWASTTTNLVIGAIEARFNGIGHEFCGDASKLYSFSEEANPNFFDRSGAVYTAGIFWDFAQFGSTVVAATGGTSTSPIVQAITLPAAGTFAALGGSPPAAACCAVVRDWLVLGHTYDATNGEQYTRVWWSGNNQITQWPTDPATKAAVLSDWQDLKQDGGDVTRIIGGSFGLVFQHTNITRMTPTGDERQFQFEIISDRLGSYSPRSVVLANGVIYFWSGASFCRITADGSVSMIGAGKVDKAFYAIGGGAESTDVCGAYSQSENSITWMASTTSDTLYRYHINENRWTLLDLSVMGLAIFPQHLYTAKRGLADAGLMMFGSDKKLYKKDAAVAFQVDSGEKRLNGDGIAMAHLIRPLQKSAVGSPAVTPLTRMVQDGSQTVGTAFSQHATNGYFQGRIAARYHAFRYTGTISNPSQSIMGLDVEFVPQGRV